VTRSLIVGVDDTDDSRNALARAAELADDRSAAAIVVGGRPHKAALSGLAGSVGAALVHRFHRSVLIVRGGDSAWNPARASDPVLRAVSSQPARSAD
jgi:nucleotide-binding universal stress UspA family protein